jgi:protein SCO1/2
MQDDPRKPGKKPIKSNEQRQRETLMMLCVAALGFVFIVARMPTPDQETRARVMAERHRTAGGIEPRFQLYDTGGRLVTGESFKGRQMLVFFGYTHCPDICPTTLATISQALKLAGRKADDIVPIFITLDPEHDDARQLYDYLRAIDPRIMGLRGSVEATNDAVKSFKAYYEFSGVKDGLPVIIHSSYVYWFDESGNYIRHFDSTIAPKEMAQSLKDGL